MLLFKEFEFDNLSNLQNKISDLLPEWVYDSESREMKSGVFSIPDLKQKILQFDELKELEKRFGLTGCINTIRFSIAAAGNEYLMHVDDMGPHVVSLNIPICGCDGTFINFYESSKELIKKTYYNENINREFYLLTADKEDCALIESHEVKNKLYAVRTDILHEVTPPKEIRISVLLRLNMINSIEEI